MATVQMRLTWRKGALGDNGKCVEVAQNTEVEGGRAPRTANPSALAQFLLEVIRDATADDASQRRSLKFWRFVRATWLAFACLAIAASLILGAATAGTAMLLGFHARLALGIGAGSSSSVILAAAFGMGRGVRLLVRALSESDGRKSGRSAAP
jgi:hypothetical protein